MSRLKRYIDRVVRREIHRISDDSWDDMPWPGESFRSILRTISWLSSHLPNELDYLKSNEIKYGPVPYKRLRKVYSDMLPSLAILKSHAMRKEPFGNDDIKYIIQKAEKIKQDCKKFFSETALTTFKKIVSSMDAIIFALKNPI